MSFHNVMLKGVSKRFRAATDFADRFAMLAGLAEPPPTVHAVDKVDLAIGKGEVVGLVGESGCGKSTLARLAAGILPPSEGKVFYEEQDFTDLTGGTRRKKTVGVQMVFQSPMNALNPRFRVADLIGEAAVFHGMVKRSQVGAHVDALLDKIGLDPSVKSRFPHQFSGGQLARINIARALSVSPHTLICDEATAALDVSIQAQIINLLMRLREELGLAYLFVSHDLGVVRHISNRVAVMYLGRIVEIGPVEEIFRAPAHPYTRALLSEIPRIATEKRRFAAISGEIPSPLAPPGGCHFHPRCPVATSRCAVDRPELVAVGASRAAACLLVGEPASEAQAKTLPPDLDGDTITTGGKA